MAIEIASWVLDFAASREKILFRHYKEPWNAAIKSFSMSCFSALCAVKSCSCSCSFTWHLVSSPLSSSLPFRFIHIFPDMSLTT